MEHCFIIVMCKKVSVPTSISLAKSICMSISLRRILQSIFHRCMSVFTHDGQFFGSRVLPDALPLVA